MKSEEMENERREMRGQNRMKWSMWVNAGERNLERNAGAGMTWESERDEKRRRTENVKNSRNRMRNLWEQEWNGRMQRKSRGMNEEKSWGRCTQQRYPAEPRRKHAGRKSMVSRYPLLSTGTPECRCRQQAGPRNPECRHSTQQRENPEINVFSWIGRMIE